MTENIGRVDLVIVGAGEFRALTQIDPLLTGFRVAWIDHGKNVSRSKS
jgi:hypothetical protein